MDKKEKGLLIAFLGIFAFTVIALTVYFALGVPRAQATPTAAPTGAPTVTPTAEPLTPGSAVTVEGVELKNGSVMYESRLCVRLDELDAALYIHGGAPEPTFSRDGTDYVAIDDACAALEMSQFYDAQFDRIYCTSGAGDWQEPAGYKLPALMYHAVSDDTWGMEDLFVSPAEMEAQIVWLLDNGYQPIRFEDLRYLDSYQKPILLCFDDGYSNNYTELYPILQKYGVKATFFVISGCVDSGEDYMTSEQVLELSRSGLVSIQSHSASHPDLSSLSRSEQEAELYDSKLTLLRMTGREPFVFCYPYGLQNEETRLLVDRYYKYGVMTSGSAYTTGEDSTQIFRMNVPRTMGIEEFAHAISNFTLW